MSLLGTEETHRPRQKMSAVRPVSHADPCPQFWMDRTQQHGWSDLSELRLPSFFVFSCGSGQRFAILKALDEEPLHRAQRTILHPRGVRLFDIFIFCL
jgi:hypothetical protein